MNRQFFVYILTNKIHTVLYTGVTNSLERRVYEHKHKLVPGFTSKYNVNKLVYFEEGNDIREAIAREKEIKGWRRSRKAEPVETMNPQWQDLSVEWPT